MEFSCGIFSSQACDPFKVDRPSLPCKTRCNSMISQRLNDSLKSKNIKVFSQHLIREVKNQSFGSSFLRGSITINTNLKRNIACRKSSAVYASLIPCSQIASGAFTLGTAAVLPFYTLMIVAPRAEFTKKVVASNLPYVVLGALYGYLLFLSWTPDTLRIIFASKYWMPELPGILKMFSSEMTMSSAWIHLLTVDLFAARHVYGDGLQNNIETRHSVSLCLLFCPVGILTHALTIALTRRKENDTKFTDEEEAIPTDFIK